MVPEAEDNYSGDFCSILCLKTTPTVVVLATKNGVIHHCIVLEDEDAQDGNEEVRVCVFHIWRVLFMQFIYAQRALNYSWLLTNSIVHLKALHMRKESPVSPPPPQPLANSSFIGVIFHIGKSQVRMC